MHWPQLPVPRHFDPDRVDQVWRVPYQERAREAKEWRVRYGVTPAAQDRIRVCLVAVDVQNTFCIPGFELFVAGASGRAAVEDNQRLCRFLYRNLGVITRICPTLDTHRPVQIFHPLFLINEAGEHPDPYTVVSSEDVRGGLWRINPVACSQIGMDPETGQAHLLHYVSRLQEEGQYQLTVWPYHGMLGGIGHALVSSLEETVFFHSVCRQSQPDFQVKGDSPLTEHYSVLGPEVMEGADGAPIGKKNRTFLESLMTCDVVIVAGQAKSHCVAWTVDHLLEECSAGPENFAEKVYLLKDCTSPVVVPGVVDYTEDATAAFRRFADAGMHVVRSTDPMESWPGIP
jgi:nicotinamidase-related amidase